MNFPDNLKYTNDHEWIRVEGNLGTIGITAHAQGELGDIVYVDIQELGQVMGKGQVFGTIEAVKTVADLLMPVTGEVVEVNSTLSDHPEIINTDPYGEGWIIKVLIGNPDELNHLMDVIAYKALVGQE